MTEERAHVEGMHMSSMRKPKDRDFVETREGMFFCATGYLHPPDGVTAYLKYSPSTEGKWKKGGVAYKREIPYYHVSSVSATIRYLKEYFPHYVRFCPVCQAEMSIVPRNYMKAYYEPENRLENILRSPKDELEAKVTSFSEDLIATGVPPAALGVTGSILIGLHNPSFSDIDIVVYGKEAARKTKDGLRSLDISLTDARKEEWIARKTGIFNLEREEAKVFLSRKWNYGFYKSTYFSVHPTRMDAEIAEDYSSVQCEEFGAATVRAEITDSSESSFLPAVYKVGDVEVVEGKDVPVKEVVSYEALYCDVFVEGDRIEARGRLEKVNSTYRVLLGALEVRDQYIHFLRHL